LIFGSVILGVGCGLFFGDLTAGLQIVGDVYVGLLQMTVLPYIVFALISSIGRLSLTEGKKLATVSISVLAVLWGVAILTVALMSLSLPTRNEGAFFSTQLIEPQQGIDFVQLFVPSNPFRSLANNTAPAVVVFCIMFGVALMKVERKESLLKHFDTVVATLFRVNSFVVSLSPIGIFAITAAAAGTLSLEEFTRLQAYLLTFTFAALLLTLWVLPMLIAACTPFKYVDILAVSKNALITVLVIQNLFVIIPMLAEGIKQLAEKYQIGGTETAAHPDFVIPLAYPFPHLGKVLTLIFIPFAAWFYGSAMNLVDFPVFLSTGLVLSFGKVTTTIPFLLDMQELPSDIFQLFLVSSVFAGGISDLVGAMHLMAFTALTVCAMAGQIRVNPGKVAILLIVTVFVGSAMIMGTRAVLVATSAEARGKDETVLGMSSMLPKVSLMSMLESSPNPVPLKPNQSRLERIQGRGIIRIGFRPDALPFSFFNTQGDLVGLDIDMAHSLAGDLGVSIEFVPLVLSNLPEQLSEDHIDIAFAGVPATTRWALSVPLSEPYMDLTLALVVPDHLNDEFSDMESIRARGVFNLGIPTGSFFAYEIQDNVPMANVIQLESTRQFFEGPPEPMDVLLTSAEGGSAWTLIYPDYTVVNPKSRPTKIPISYPYAGPDLHFEEFLEHWIQLKRKDGTVEELYDYWALGRGAQVNEPRWSVVRDVLHWIE
jgi:Na+/H+-dicarboxylate symporter/ABC-type amino acid transport substrate-binding protein